MTLNSIKTMIRQINMNLSDEKNIGFLSLDSIKEQQTIIANMALMYAQADKRVLIVDFDFSSHAFLDTFHLKNEMGVSDYLDGKVSKDQLVNKTPAKNVSIITSGSLDIDETQYLMGDPKINTLLTLANEDFDVVLWSLPKYVNESEFRGVYKTLSGIVLVVGVGSVAKMKIVRMINKLKKDQVKILGYISAKK